MNCQTCKGVLSAYRDQELGGKEMLAVRAHLSECEECRQELAAIEAIHRALGRLNKVPVPTGLENRIHGAVFRPKPRPGAPLQMAAWGGLAATAALCAVLVFQFTNPSGGGSMSEVLDGPTANELALSNSADPLGVYVPVLSVSDPGPGQ